MFDRAVTSRSHARGHRQGSQSTGALRRRVSDGVVVAARRGPLPIPQMAFCLPSLSSGATVLFCCRRQQSCRPQRPTAAYSTHRPPHRRWLSAMAAAFLLVVSWGIRDAAHCRNSIRNLGCIMNIFQRNPGLESTPQIRL